MSDTETMPAAAGAAGLAEARRRLLGRMLRGEVQAPAPRAGITRAPGGPEYPVSEQQAQLLFMHELKPESPYYNLATAHRISAETELPLLERALAELVRRHEALRTVFRWVEGEPRQVVHPPYPVRLEVEELRGPGGAPCSEALAREKVREWSARPFDLWAGPLFRCSMGRISDADYLLVFTCHHLISDGWSLAVLMRELAELYVAFGRGEPSPLPEPRIHYPDYAVWQRAYLEGGALERQLAFWREQLRGAPAETGLPADRPRPKVQANRGAMHRFLYPDALLERLNAVARESGATLNMVFLAALALLLRRYGGSDDVVLGAGLGNRNREELESMVGYLVQSGAVRVRLDGDPGFREAVRRARNAVLDAEAHQETPFRRVVEAVNAPRDPARNPLFQVMYVHRSWVRVHQVEEGLRRALELRPFYQETGDTFVETGAARFDMLWTMGEGTGGMAGSLEYDSALFDAGTVARMEAQLRAILEAGAADPDTPVSRLPLLSEAERAALAAWECPERVEAPEPLVHRMIAAQAARTPGAAALVFRGATLSYAELDRRANRLANRLVRLRAEPETRVGICLERGAETPVAILAVLKAGAAYLPLDPAYPAERLAYMRADARISLLVTQSSLRHLFPAENVRTVAVDEDAAAIAAESAEAPRTAVAAENAAYVIYTSGSTGRPKGVVVTHANAAAFFAGIDRRVGTTPGTWLAVSRVSFDMHVLDLLWTLSRGFRVIVQPEVGDAAEDESIPRQVRRHGVTHLQATATLARLLVDEEGTDWLAGLDRLLLGGETLPPDLAARIDAAMPGRLVNLYGPTETTVYCSGDRVDDVAAIHMGRPLANARVYVLDAGMRQLPAGVPGELFVAGAYVARGYLHRPALTAERFLPDPFTAEPGARMYRSGDRGHWRADGKLVSGGRLDQQVKVRGFRIEPGEIEAVLRGVDGVEACAVVAREDEPGRARLVAYVVGGTDEEAMRAHLRRTLPEHMVPADFVAIDGLPLTPSGKLDRRALPAPGRAAAEDAYVAPRTPVEAALAAIWQEVLRRERVGVRDNFFDLGGHSLIATRVAMRIQRVLEADVGLVALFEHPTVERLAERVEEIRRAALPAPPPIVRTERTGPPPLSFAQERLWFLDQLDAPGALYNVPAALRLSGVLHRAALERALGEIVRRHEPLRTVFAADEAGPTQVVLPFQGFSLAMDDLSGFDPTAREAETEQRIRAEAQRPFELAGGPLFRARLLRLDAEEHVLVICIHHVVCDGWSLGVLFRELSGLYAAFAEGRSSPLPEPAVRYADFAAWQREHLRGEVLAARVAYWKARLAGAPALLELPSDHPRPPVQSYRGASERVHLPAELVARLQALGREEGATLYMVLLAAFQLLLARYAGVDDVVVGSPVAGRTRREVEGMIGLFLNTLALRTDLSGAPTFREVLRRVRETTLGAYLHQDLPFEKLVEELQPERSRAHSPIFQVMLALQDESAAAPRLSGLRVREMEAPIDAAKFDLSLILTPTDDGLRGGLSYSTDLWDAESIRRMISHLQRVLEQVAADADVRLSAIDLVGDDERKRVLEEWNPADLIDPDPLCIHRSIAAQAARTPDATAVIAADGSLTCAEVDARANHLANHLLRLGAGPERRVAICLERGAEMVVALLAVLKAGAAYLPLDPAYPAERLAYMRADAGASLLVTQSSRRGLFAGEGVRIVSVDADAAAISAESSQAPATAVSPDNAAYVIYTSGSTGRPKGVVVTHANAAAFFAGIDGRIGGTIPGTWLAVTRIGFDIHVLELLWTLARGFRVVVQPDVDDAEAASIPEQIRQHDVTHLQCTPSLARLLVDEAGAEALAGLDRLLLGGEALPPDLPARIGAVLPGRLANLYGPTEATVWCTTHAVNDATGSIPIGRPLPGTRAYVLDSALRPLPIGLPGELYVGGAQVARGYLHRAALTAERFIPDPYAARPGARLYRTGDRARWRADGALEYLGRLDQQVKIRGFRIEPGEVEAVLRQDAGVRDCAVVARADAPGGPRLVAYTVGEADADALRTHLRRSLPEHMVPAAFVAVERLPLTPSGKLDRRALPAPEAAPAREAYVAPRTPLESALAAIWAEALGRRVGVRDNFFDIGGHSLLGTRVAMRIQRELNARASLVALFEHPTIESLAAALAAQPAAPSIPLRRRAASAAG